jgi:hypothetical protein
MGGYDQRIWFDGVDIKMIVVPSSCSLSAFVPNPLEWVVEQRKKKKRDYDRRTNYTMENKDKKALWFEVESNGRPFSVPPFFRNHVLRTRSSTTIIQESYASLWFIDQ